MEDEKIIDLYWGRNEKAIEESDEKYGGYCGKIAFNVLQNHEDSEECVNDTWHKSWNSMPDARPHNLPAFFGTICRNISLDRYRSRHSVKRGGGQMDAIYEELEECVGKDDVEATLNQQELERAMQSFVSGMKKEDRIIFVKRYWYMESVKDIAGALLISESKVKTRLFRIRQNLAEYLKAEDIVI